MKCRNQVWCYPRRLPP